MLPGMLPVVVGAVGEIASKKKKIRKSKSFC